MQATYMSMMMVVVMDGRVMMYENCFDCWIQQLSGALARS